MPESGFSGFTSVIFQKIAHRLIKIDYVKKAIDEKADLSVFREKPTLRIIIGIVLMAFSYVLGWPAVSFFGVLAIIFKEPLIAIIGGPVIYGISHLVFLAGFYLAGAQYSMIFLRWATRKGVEMLMRMGKAKDVPEAGMNG
ncbi:MAG TPA: hypothetical protein PK926_06355 [Spirochaetota bacterium]|nr:hypothetical protein [Spirochaetota bacterium]HPI89617.1 hypothetical protein [Spirochaetota bacterium]HPR49196.1 hypothetical protein [Spirochaetota bacterium]